MNSDLNGWLQGQPDMNTARTNLESIRKDASDPTLTVGDVVFRAGTYVQVDVITRYAPGMHPDSPIRDDYVATEIRTELGSRWFGSETA